MAIIERRFAHFDDVEVRQEDDSPIRFLGHAAVFGDTAEIGGMFRERVDPKAFNKTIKEADVRFLFNHDPDSVMARSKNGTLRLSVDDRGLLSDADLPADDWDVQRIVPKIQRGDVDQMSFAFRSIDDDWDENPEDGGLPIRTLKQVQLFDVSPVTFPAYEGTDAEAVSVRALLDGRPEVREIVERAAISEDEQESTEATESPAGDEPSREEHSLVERQQALMAQVLEKIEQSIGGSHE